MTKNWIITTSLAAEVSYKFIVTQMRFVPDQFRTFRVTLAYDLALIVAINTGIYDNNMSSSEFLV